MKKTRTMALGCAMVIVTTSFFFGCGNAKLAGPGPLPIPLQFQEFTYLVGDVLVSFRVEEINNFSSVSYDFNGQLRNSGPTLVNARFEIVTETRVNLPGNGREKKIIATQFFDRFPTGSNQQIALSAEVVNLSNVTVAGRFVSDGPEPPPVAPVTASSP